MDIDNLSGIFKGNVNGLENTNEDVEEDNIRKKSKNNTDHIFSEKVNGLDASKISHMFSKIKNKQKGGFEKMLGINIKTKSSQLKDLKGDLKVNKFFNMSSSVKSPKNNSEDKIKSMLGGLGGKTNIKSKNPFSENNKKIDEMFGMSKNKNNFNINNAFKMNSNVNINKKLNKMFSIKGVEKNVNLNNKIGKMIGSPLGLEQKGWNRSKQQVGLNPLGDFDGDKVINMLDCNPRNPYEQGPLDTLGQWGRALRGKEVKTSVGQLPIYRDPNAEELIDSTVIEIDPTKAGQELWKGAKVAGVATVVGLQKVGTVTGKGLKNIAIGSGLYKTEEQRKMEARFRHQEELARIKKLGLEDDIPLPSPKLTPTQIVRQRGLGAISVLGEGAGRIHSNISEAVRLGSIGGTQSISQVIGMGRGTPGMAEYLSATGTRPLSEKLGLVSLGVEVPFSEKAKLIGGAPTEQSYAYKVQEAIGGLKSEDVELAEKFQRERLEQLKKQELVEQQKRLVVPFVVPQQSVPQVYPQQQVLLQPQIRQPLSYEQQQYAAQASPVLDIYSDYSKRKVGYTRGRYKKHPKPGVPQIVYQPVQ